MEFIKIIQPSSASSDTAAEMASVYPKLRRLWAVGLLMLLVSLPAPAATPTLESLIKSAVAGNATIKESRAEVMVAEAQKDRAGAASQPRAQATILAAPLPAQRGNPTQSSTDWGTWGPFVTGGLQIIQPLYTFGQIGGYQDAAEGQLAAKKELANATRDAIIHQTKEYYYGFLMAARLDRLVKEMLKFLEEAIVEADKQRKKKGSKIRPHDIYELKSETETLRQLGLAAEAGRKTAERAVEWIAATKFDSLKAKKLKPQSFEKKSLEEYLQIARDNRPELKALRKGIEARAALRDAKRAQSYPVLFFGGAFSFAWSSVADDQKSIFANDPFNQVIGGGGVGLRFDLEFGRHAAEAAEEEAERMKLKAKQEFAKPGIDVEVKKAFWELEQAEKGLEIAKERRKLTKKWFVSNASGWTLGIVKSRDLMDSLQGSGLARKNYIETVYAYNMALATLSKAVGKEITDLSY